MVIHGLETSINASLTEQTMSVFVAPWGEHALARRLCEKQPYCWRSRGAVTAMQSLQVRLVQHQHRVANDHHELYREESQTGIKTNRTPDSRDTIVHRYTKLPDLSDLCTIQSTKPNMLETPESKQKWQRHNDPGDSCLKNKPTFHAA